MADSLEQLQAMNQFLQLQNQNRSQNDYYDSYTPQQRDTGGMGNAFAGTLGGALGSIGAGLQANADRSMQLRALEAQQQNAQIPYNIAALQQQGQTDRLAMLSPIFGALMGGGSGSARPGNITSNIGSGVFWSGGQGASGNGQGPQTYDYGKAPPGTFIPQAQGQSSPSQSQYTPPNYSGGATASQPALNVPTASPASSGAMGGQNSAAQRAAAYQQQAGGAMGGYKPPSPYGPADRYNRYRDELPFVGDDSILNPMQRKANDDWRAGINGYRA